MTHRVRTSLAGADDVSCERETIVFRRGADGRWLAVHEHLSLDPEERNDPTSSRAPDRTTGSSDRRALSTSPASPGRRPSRGCRGSTRSSHADVAILGIPFDSGVSYRPGARFGPAGIRAGSKLLRPYHPYLDVYPWGVQQVADAGDVAVNPFDLMAAVGQVEAAARLLLGRADRIVTIGGDHTIALPLLRAMSAAHGPIALIHFDAHLDTWDTYFGAPYTHGTPFRRAVEEGLLDLDVSAHVGIRGPLYCSRATWRTTRRWGSRSSARWTSRGGASTRPSTACASASATGRSTCPSTSTCSIPRTRRVPARPSPAG